MESVPTPHSISGNESLDPAYCFQHQFTGISIIVSGKKKILTKVGFEESQQADIDPESA